MRACIYKGNNQMQRKPKIFFNIDYPRHLRGLTNNRWRGHRPSRLRPFRGSKFGAANRGRIFSADERAAWAREHGYARLIARDLHQSLIRRAQRQWLSGPVVFCPCGVVKKRNWVRSNNTPTQRNREFLERTGNSNRI